jgi:hypothetical protein
MKLEYLDDITDGGKYPYADPEKLIRLYDFTKSEAKKLMESIQFKILNQNTELKLSSLEFVHPINCSLTFEIASSKIGILPSIDNQFVCKLTIEIYKEMVEYIYPFTDKRKDLSGYNWLFDPSEKSMDLLFSADGSW